MDGLIIGGGIQGNLHAPLVGLFNNIVGSIDLILQHYHIAAFELIQYTVHIGFINVVVGAMEDQDTVLTTAVHLDHGMTADLIAALQEADIRAMLFQFPAEHLGRLTGVASVIDRNSCLSQSNGLVKALAAQEYIAVHGAFGLAGAQKIVH